MLGLGPVGAGRFAAFLARAVADVGGLPLRAVADPDRGRAEQVYARSVRTGITDLVVAAQGGPAPPSDLPCRPPPPSEQ